MVKDVGNRGELHGEGPHAGGVHWEVGKHSYAGGSLGGAPGISACVKEGRKEVGGRSWAVLQLQ